MLKSVNGKVNGERMGPYVVGQEYDVDDARALLFIGSAMAEEVIPVVEAIEVLRVEEKPERFSRKPKGA